jgi:hypothetical protein
MYAQTKDLLIFIVPVKDTTIRQVIFCHGARLPGYHIHLHFKNKYPRSSVYDSWRMLSMCGLSMWAVESVVEIGTVTTDT